MIDLTRLQAFLYAAEDLNFSEAAKRMNVTQPTISHHIKILEQTLGVQLFERSGSSIKLTEAGRILLPWAHKLLSDAVEMQQMMQSLDEHIVGEIRIACSTTTGKYVLPQFAARFREQHPGVTVNILSCGKESVIPHVLKEDADLGVVSYDACGEEVECQQFFIDHIVLIVPIEHPWAERQYIEPTELLETPFIIREPESGTRRVLLAELGKHDISLDDLESLCNLVIPKQS